MKRAKTQKHIPFLLWFIPMMTAIVTFLAFVGVCFAAVFRWMGTLKVQKQAAQLYIEQHSPDKTEENPPESHVI